MKNSGAPQAIEYLWEFRQDRADGQLPDEWFSHRTLKRTNKFVFVEYKVGLNHPSSKTMKLDRHKLEAEEHVYWHHGTWVVGFYTESGKREFQEKLLSYQRVPEYMRVLGLKQGATLEDVKRAYREKVLIEHPDKGGTHERFLKLHEHYEMALRMVKS